MFGENYSLVEAVDARGKRREQWVADISDSQNGTLVDPALVELAVSCNTDKDKFTRKTKMLCRFHVVSFSALKSFLGARVYLRSFCQSTV